MFTAADLQDALSPAAAVAQAEVLVASAICPGLPGLDERTWDIEVRLRAEPRAPGVPAFGRRRLGPAQLGVWPITALLAVTQDGRDLTAECAFDLFSILWDGANFSVATPVQVRVKTGWTAATVPAAVKQAVLLTAAAVLTAPDAGVKAEKIGEHSITYDTEGRAVLPLAVSALLRPYQVLL